VTLLILMGLFGKLLGGPIASLLNCHAPLVKRFWLFIIPEFNQIKVDIYIMYPICFGDVCIWMVIISVTVSAARMLSSGSYKL
jgi:hypothetical protein